MYINIETIIITLFSQSIFENKISLRINNKSSGKKRCFNPFGVCVFLNIKEINNHKNELAFKLRIILRIVELMLYMNMSFRQTGLEQNG